MFCPEKDCSQKRRCEFPHNCRVQPAAINGGYARGVEDAARVCDDDASKVKEQIERNNEYLRRTGRTASEANDICRGHLFVTETLAKSIRALTPAPTAAQPRAEDGEDCERLIKDREQFAKAAETLQREHAIAVDKMAIAERRAQQVEATAETLRQERDEADRRAGCAERKSADLQEQTYKSTRWLDDAKRARGYNTNVSFDVVWKETCENADRATAAEASLRQAEERVRALERAIMSDERVLPSAFEDRGFRGEIADALWEESGGSHQSGEFYDEAMRIADVVLSVVRARAALTRDGATGEAG